MDVKKTLITIAAILNDNNVNWGLGGSLLLYLHGIDTTVSDIDIVIDENEIEKIEKIVSKYKHIEKQKTDIYLTRKFYSITIKGIDVDLIIGFKVVSKNGVYSYPKGKKLIDKSIIIDKTVINMCSLKDWLETYKAMNREEKVKLIQQVIESK